MLLLGKKNFTRKIETFKNHLRKKAAKHRQTLYKTGGEVVIEVPSLTPSEEKIYIISLSINEYFLEYPLKNTNRINKCH